MIKILETLKPNVLIASKFVNGVLPLIDSATDKISIIVFDWRLYPTQQNHPVTRLVNSLIAAIERGVVVRVLTPHSGVRADLVRLGFKCRTVYSGKIMHAKVMLIDDIHCIVGSHNYTQSGFTRNLEVSLHVPDRAMASVLNSYFDQLWSV